MAATAIGPCPCPAIVLTAVPQGQHSVLVTITAGGPVRVTLGLVNGTQYEQHGAGPFLFEGLETGTTYSVVAVNDCGQTATSQVTTAPCPGVGLTQTGQTPHSVTVQVSGSAAEVTLGDQVAQVAVGGTHTFTGLEPDSTYSIVAVNECGAKAIIAGATEPCPDIVASAIAATNTLQVTVSGGAPALVTVAGITKNAPTDGSVVEFSALAPDTEYNAVVASACGSQEIFTFKTLPCPDIVASYTATQNTLDVLVTAGAPAEVTVGGVTKRAAANGDTVQFTALAADTEYVATIESACGNTDILVANTLSCPAVQVEQTAATPTTVTLTLVSGAPANVTLNDVTKRITTDGGTATWTGLTPNTSLAVTALSDCNGGCGNACAKTDLFEAVTPPCPEVDATVSAVNYYGFTLTVNSAEPVTVEVYDADNRVQAVEVGLTGTKVFAGLADGQRVRVVVFNDCGSVWRQVVHLPAAPEFCASRPLYKYGYGFAPGDYADPAATQTVTAVGSGETFLVFPTAGVGHTAPVRDEAGAILGYAANRSACAYDGCCTPEEYK